MVSLLLKFDNIYIRTYISVHPSVGHDVLVLGHLQFCAGSLKVRGFELRCAGRPQEHCLFPYTSLAGSFTQTHGVVVSWCTRTFRPRGGLLLQTGRFGRCHISGACNFSLHLLYSCRKFLHQMFRDVSELKLGHRNILELY